MHVCIKTRDNNEHDTEIIYCQGASNQCIYFISVVDNLLIQHFTRGEECSAVSVMVSVMVPFYEKKFKKNCFGLIFFHSLGQVSHCF